MRKRPSERAKLENINVQQRHIIQILSDAYNSPQNRGKVYEIIRDYCIGHGATETGASSPSQYIDMDEEIKCLEQEIAEQDIAYARLERQLAEYNQQARQYEDMLARNEKEKADLLASFQRRVEFGESSNSGTASRSQMLLSKSEEISAECEKVKQRSNDARELCQQVQEELVKSREECKILESQVEQAKAHLRHASESGDDIDDDGDEVLKRQISEQDRIIDSLNMEIEEANAEIAKLKKENQALCDQLVNAGSESM